MLHLDVAPLPLGPQEVLASWEPWRALGPPVPSSCPEGGEVVVLVVAVEAPVQVEGELVQVPA